jgi:hypothetical protein
VEVVVLLELVLRRLRGNNKDRVVLRRLRGHEYSEDRIVLLGKYSEDGLVPPRLRRNVERQMPFAGVTGVDFASAALE